MLLAEPDRTPFDFHFGIGGFPVRVTPFFWVAAAVLGWDEANQLGQLDFPGNPGAGGLLLLWCATMFLSILVHELGHAFAMRWYGNSASIVLYHFGGLAIPDSFRGFDTSWRFRSRENPIVISAAGPAAQLMLAAIVIVAVELSGHAFAEKIWPLSQFLGQSGKPRLPMSVGSVGLFFLAAPSVYWALLNLLPVFPLDGGQISRELFVRVQGSAGVEPSLWLSLATAVAGAVFAWQQEQPFMGMLFLSLALSSYQLLQMMRFGGGRW